MHPVVELLWSVVMSLFYIVVGSIRALLPASILPKKNLKGQTVLITGAGSGLGRMLSMQFAKLGCNLVLWDINQEANEATAAEAKELGVNVQSHVVDLSNRDDIYKVADKVKDEVKSVDVLVNNAGIVTGRKFLQCSDNMIQKTMEVNIMAHFWTTKAFLPSMLKKNSGHVVTIASMAGVSGATGLCDYCASKFAAVGFTESLRSELKSLGRDGVYTTVVCPYYINTGMFEGVTTKYPFLLPILEPDYVVDKIMDAVLTNQEVLLLPRITYFFNCLKSVLPVQCSDYLADVLGINSTMDMFVGRQKQE